MRSLFCALALAASLAACAAPSAPEPAALVQPPDVGIPASSFGVVKGWERRADGAVVLTGDRNAVFRVTFLEACRPLNAAAPAVAVMAGPLDSASRFSSIIVNGDTCRFATLEEVIDPASRAQAAPSAPVEGKPLP